MQDRILCRLVEMLPARRGHDDAGHTSNLRNCNEENDFYVVNSLAFAYLCFRVDRRRAIDQRWRSNPVFRGLRFRGFSVGVKGNKDNENCNQSWKVSTQQRNADIKLNARFLEGWNSGRVMSSGPRRTYRASPWRVRRDTDESQSSRSKRISRSEQLDGTHSVRPRAGQSGLRCVVPSETRKRCSSGASAMVRAGRLVSKKPKPAARSGLRSHKVQLSVELETKRGLGTWTVKEGRRQRIRRRHLMNRHAEILVDSACAPGRSGRAMRGSLRTFPCLDRGCAELRRNAAMRGSGLRIGLQPRRLMASEGASSLRQRLFAEVRS